ncbi:MAG: InlB B-repeat-containing protein [Bacilli bacterium]|nr:InlB B-repeat-containing protein [Bacilli bacterium]
MIKKISTILFVGFAILAIVGCTTTPTTATYTVTFDSNGGSEVAAVTVESGHTVAKPADPTKEGYTFVGWFYYDSAWDFGVNTIGSNITLTAKWEEESGAEHEHIFVDGECACGEKDPNYAPKEYKVTLRPNGGTLTERTIYFTDYASVTLPIPTRDGYDFDGWYSDGELVETLAENKNYTLEASWTGQTKTITYVLNDGVVEGGLVESFQVGTSVMLPTPKKDGYRFLGWYLNAEFSGSAIVKTSTAYKNDITIYAKWEEVMPLVTYELNGGNWSYTTREEMVADFLNDAKAWGGVSANIDGMVQGAGKTQVGFANKFSAIYGFFGDARYASKWAWLKAYIINVTSNATSKSSLQKGDEAFWRYSLGAFLFKEHRNTYPISEDFTKEKAANGFWDTLSEYEICEFDITETNNVPKTPVKIYYIFDGWYDNPEFTGEKVTSFTTDITLYAKWIEETPVSDITITNKVNALDRFEEYQLTWELNPTNAAIKDVEFTTSDETIATVSESGLIYPLENGTVTITIKSLSPSGVTDSVTIEITSPDHFDISYKTNSYVSIGGEIELVAEYIKRDGTIEELTWESLTPSIATVDDGGKVKGLAEGVATIRVKVASDETIYIDFVVTVLPSELSAALEHVIASHESNIFTRYGLGIGAGTPVYYSDILGSVSKIGYGIDITYNTAHLADVMAAGNWSSGLDKVEFVTVHYTAGMTRGSDAEATAIYFKGAAVDASAHFCTGNDGVFQTLDLDVRGWHAGDGASSNFEWTATGVKYNENDPQWPEWGISPNAKFTINGQETVIQVPYKEQRGSIGYVTDSYWLNDQGLAFKVVDGEYYMGTTWWCYSNVWEGRICSRGGNKHSIGIESAVDEGSDLWYTWQLTAKLVAQLMTMYDLDITRVVGHHFFAAKDCPQPLLENDLEIWWEFIDLVEAEYELMNALKDVQFEFVSQSEYIGEYGRVTEQPEFSQIATYQVKVTENGVTKTITLASAIPGIYTK